MPLQQLALSTAALVGAVWFTHCVAVVPDTCSEAPVAAVTAAAPGHAHACLIASSRRDLAPVRAWAAQGMAPAFRASLPLPRPVAVVAVWTIRELPNLRAPTQALLQTYLT